MTQAEFNSGVKAQEAALQRKGRLEFLREDVEETKKYRLECRNLRDIWQAKMNECDAQIRKAEAEMLSLAGGMD